MFKRIKIGLAAACMVLLAGMLLSCDMEATHTTQATAPAECNYTIRLSTSGGMIFPDVAVYVYTDSSQTDLVSGAFGRLDAEGCFTFTAEVSDAYVAMLSGVPEGYDLQSAYPLLAENTEIVLTSASRKDVSVSEATKEGEKPLKTGNIFPDFSVTDIDGQAYQLSALLEQKRAVALYFWCLECPDCQVEAAYLQKAYAQNQQIEVLAVNMGGDRERTELFRDRLGLTYPVIVGNTELSQALGVAYGPAVAMIDRYGMLAVLDSKLVDTEGVLESVFGVFTEENYAQNSYSGFDAMDIDYPQGTAANPQRITGAMESFEIYMDAESLYYCNFTKCDNMTVRMESPNVFAIYEGRRVDAEDGVLEFTVTITDTFSPVEVMFGNAGETGALFFGTIGPKS